MSQEFGSDHTPSRTIVSPDSAPSVQDSAPLTASFTGYYQATGTSSRKRINLLKLVWDFVGTEFGGRQLQYEMFYSASQPVVNTRAFRGYDWDHARAPVDRCLGEY